MAGLAGSAEACARRRARMLNTRVADGAGVVSERVCIILEEAKPASIVSRARVEGRFVLRIVAMTRLTCFRRKCLLGRNLITLFQCVNSFAELFFPSPSATSRDQRHGFPGKPPSLMWQAQRHRIATLKNAAFNAVFLHAGFGALHRMMLRGAAASRHQPAFCGINGSFFRPASLRRFGRRTSPNARICANFFCRRMPSGAI